MNPTALLDRVRTLEARLMDVALCEREQQLLAVLRAADEPIVGAAELHRRLVLADPWWSIRESTIRKRYSILRGKLEDLGLGEQLVAESGRYGVVREPVA